MLFLQFLATLSKKVLKNKRSPYQDHVEAIALINLTNSVTVS
jgi:hypothetical protein